MTKKRTAFLIVMLALTICLSVSVIAADYAKITEFEGSNEAEAANPPGSIIDGDETTRWGSMAADNNAIFTFEKEETIESIDIMFFKAPERVHVVKVESSTDGSTWAEVAMAKTSGVMDGNLQPADRPDYASQGGYWDNFALSEPVTAKYWKVTFLGREESGSLDTSSPMSVWEIRFIIGQTPVAVVIEPEPATVLDIDIAPVAEPVAVAPVVVTAPATSDSIVFSILPAFLMILGFAGVKKIRKISK